MSARFLLDENMPFALLEFLTNRGHHADHLKKLGKVGIKNGEVYKLAVDLKSWILTRDSDFKNYYKFISHNVSGIIVFTLSDTTTRNMLDVMSRLMKTHHNKLESKHLIIINDNTIKIYD